jgi:WD40 repeat protein
MNLVFQQESHIMKNLFLTLIIIMFLVLRLSKVDAQIDCDARFIAWHPKMSQFAFTCDTLIHIYTSDFQFVMTLENPPEPPDTFPRIPALKWSPDGNYLASATLRSDAPGGDGNASRVVIWDMRTARIILDIPNRTGDFSWSLDSRFVAVDSLYMLDSLYFYEIEPRNEIRHCEACSNPVGMQWNPNNLDQFVVVNPIQILVFDPMALNETPLVLDNLTAFSEGFSPDGTKIITYNREALQIEVRNTTTWLIISSLPFSSSWPVNNVIWLENGIYIDNAIEGTLFWDGVSQQILTLPINEIRFILSSDGSSYLSPNPDGIFLYESTTGNYLDGLLFETVTLN